MKMTKPKGFPRNLNRRQYHQNIEINKLNRVLNLYYQLPRLPKQPCPMDQLQLKVRSWYNDEIDDQSMRKAIKRDLDKLKSILVTGAVNCIPKKGNQPSE